MTSRQRGALPTRRACDLDEFRAVVEQTIDLADFPLAARITQGVPVYNVSILARGPGAAPEHRSALRDELTAALVGGPGIVVLEAAVAPDAAHRVSRVFWDLIGAQRAHAGPAGDHFARPGANDRLWNALEKLAVADPDAFVDYHASDAVAVACEAWLGPRYQITEQVNVVNPGGEAQQPHRDYHMGFLTDDEAEQYPRHAHLMSAMLTLQGAIAHCDMGVESGPTMYLPHSHKYELGYLAWRRREFIDYFDERRVQLPLRTGDAVFFSPAMFCAAGHNRTADVRRMANLLQISSAFGRATEAVDRTRVVNAVYPALRARLAAGMSRAAAANVVAACAEGYAFPTDLDRDQPTDGLAPPSQADLVSLALDEDWAPPRLRDEIRRQNHRRRSALSAPTTAEEMLQEARLQFEHTTPAQLAATLNAGPSTARPDRCGGAQLSAPVRAADEPPLVIDIRDIADRERTGIIEGSVPLPLIALEWRLDLSSGHSHPAVESLRQPLVMVCNEGYKSSLAAACALRLGFTRVTDLAGGIQAWAEAGLPLVAPCERDGPR